MKNNLKSHEEKCKIFSVKYLFHVFIAEHLFEIKLPKFKQELS